MNLFPFILSTWPLARCTLPNKDIHICNRLHIFQTFLNLKISYFIFKFDRGIDMIQLGSKKKKGVPFFHNECIKKSTWKLNDIYNNHWMHDDLIMQVLLFSRLCWCCCCWEFPSCFWSWPWDSTQLWDPPWCLTNSVHCFMVGISIFIHKGQHSVIWQMGIFWCFKIKFCHFKG